MHTATASTAGQEQCGKERVIHVTFILEHAGVFLARNSVVFECWVVTTNVLGLKCGFSFTGQSSENQQGLPCFSRSLAGCVVPSLVLSLLCCYLYYTTTLPFSLAFLAYFLYRIAICGLCFKCVNLKISDCLYLMLTPGIKI